MGELTLSCPGVLTLAPPRGPCEPQAPALEPAGHPLERELVDGVDLVEVNEDEVEQGSPLRGRAVVLAGLVDLGFCDFCLLYLKADRRAMDEAGRWTRRWPRPTRSSCSQGSFADGRALDTPGPSSPRPPQVLR